MITLEEIQKRLSEALTESGLTQKEIASKIKITQSSIAHYKKGDKMPALDTFANLCIALDLDANEILTGKKI